MITSGNFRTLSLSEAISAAKEELRIEGTQQHDNSLERLANEALTSMDSASNVIKIRKRVELIDGRIELPVGFVRWLMLSYECDELSESNVTTMPYTPIYVNSPYFDACGCTHLIGGRPYTAAFQIIGNYIVFTYPNDVSDSSMILVYEGRNVDCDGLMIMYDYQERGVVAYICYKFMRRYPEQYDRGSMMDWKREWVDQKAYAKGVPVQIDFEQNKAQINSIWNAWKYSHRVR